VDRAYKWRCSRLTTLISINPIRGSARSFTLAFRSSERSRTVGQESGPSSSFVDRVRQRRSQAQMEPS
jgi:hypothetical protein